MRRASLTAILTAATLLPTPLWGPSVAFAAEPRVGLLPLDVEGTLPPNGDTQFSAEFEQGVTAAGATIVPAAELASALGGPPSSCRDETCLRALATAISATHLVRPSVRLHESDYVITLEVIDGATGTVAHRSEQVCELCGLSEAITVAGTLAAALPEHLTTPDAGSGTLTVATTPAGVQVRLDGEVVGVTPLELSVPPGEHRVTLRREGYADAERTVAVEAGGTATVELALVPAGAEDERRPLPPIVRPLGWAAVGVGGASLVSGIALLVLDGRPVEYTRCSGPDVDTDGNCRYRHKTLAGGVIMTVLGVVGVTAGALLLVRTRHDAARSDRRARLRPSARGLALRF